MAQSKTERAASKNAWQKVYYVTHKTEKAAYDVAYKRANRDKKAAAVRAYHLRRKYGLSLEAYGTMLAAQDNLCALCHQPFTTRPNVDHDHQTGRVRGLIHSRCNTGLGFLDDAEWMAQAKAYLR